MCQVVLTNTEQLECSKKQNFLFLLRGFVFVPKYGVNDTPISYRCTLLVAMHIC